MCLRICMFFCNDVISDLAYVMVSMRCKKSSDAYRFLRITYSELNKLVDKCALSAKESVFSLPETGCVN